MQRMELKFDHFPVETGSMLQPDSIVEKQHSCSKCDRTFDKPKLIQYYACPHCMTKIEEERKMGCQYWFGYLNQKAKDEPMPKGCVECEKVVECMLKQYYDSARTRTLPLRVERTNFSTRQEIKSADFAPRQKKEGKIRHLILSRLGRQDSNIF